MAAPKPLKNYPCTQAELYAICEIGWNSFTENLADFTPFKSYYDAAYATASKAEVAITVSKAGYQNTSETVHVAVGNTFTFNYSLNPEA